MSRLNPFWTSPCRVSAMIGLSQLEKREHVFREQPAAAPSRPRLYDSAKFVVGWLAGYRQVTIGASRPG